MSTKPVVVAVVGPTGSGKTELGIRLASHFGTVILSADSRQFYRGMPIGTAQPDEEQLLAVKHYFIASHSVEEPVTAGRYATEALALLPSLFERNRIVIVVGGSGLYVNALCHGMDELPKADPALRETLSARLRQEGLTSLLEELKELDPRFYEQMDRNNPVRVMRALEVCLCSGQPYSSLRSGKGQPRPFETVKIGIRMDRSELYDRIDRRVDAMMEAGLEAEAKALYPFRQLNALQTVGYRELFDCFDGKTTREEAIALIKRNSRRYAKRQITWFGHDPQIEWFDPNETDSIIRYIEKKIG